MSGNDTLEGSALNENETSAIQVQKDEKVTDDNGNDPDASDSSCVICLETMNRGYCLCLR